MLINVVDLETCGFEAGVVEVAMVSVGEVDGEYFTELCKPDVPISFEAMATHHITEDMVKDALPFETVITDRFLATGRGYAELEAEVFAAHNAEFDRKFFPEHIKNARWIDTWRCSLHLWPEAPGHGNQVLRYWLGLDVSDMPAEAGGMAHRALYDAWCTAAMLRRMIDHLVQIELSNLSPVEDVVLSEAHNRAVEHLLKLSSEPVVLRKVRFGKHRDSLWADVPRDYLQWCLRQRDMDADVLHTCRHHLGLVK